MAAGGLRLPGIFLTPAPLRHCNSPFGAPAKRPPRPVVPRPVCAEQLRYAAGPSAPLGRASGRFAALRPAPAGLRLPLRGTGRAARVLPWPTGAGPCPSLRRCGGPPASRLLRPAAAGRAPGPGWGSCCGPARRCGLPAGVVALGLLRALLRAPCALAGPPSPHFFALLLPRPGAKRPPLAAACGGLCPRARGGLAGVARLRPRCASRTHVLFPGLDGAALMCYSGTGVRVRTDRNRGVKAWTNSQSSAVMWML